MDRGKLNFPVKRYILAAILIGWVVLWVMFLVREAFLKGGFKDYTALAGRTFEGKHAYVTGDDLYAFIAFCRDRTPEGSTFLFEGLEDGSLEKRRATYYLYPRLEREDAEYIFVYGVSGFSRPGYSLYERSGDGNSIMRRSGR